MKFSVSSKLLLNKIAPFLTIPSIRNKAIITDFALFTVVDNILTMRGTNGEVTIETSLPVELAVNGSSCIPIRILVDTLKNLGDEQLLIRTHDTKLSVIMEYDGGKSEFACVDVKDFPQEPAIVVEQYNTVLREDLLSTLASASRFVSTEKMRPSLAGVYMKIMDGHAEIVGTDAVQLICSTINIQTEVQGDGIIPSRSVTVIRAAFLKADDNLLIAFSDKKLVIKDSTTSIYVTLVDAAYPNYKSVIPENMDKTVFINKDSLSSIIARASVFASESGLIKLFMFENQLEVTATDLDFGKSSSNKMVIDYTGEQFFISVKAEQLQNAVSAIDVQDIQIGFTDEQHPLILLGEAVTCLVMAFK